MQNHFALLKSPVFGRERVAALFSFIRACKRPPKLVRANKRARPRVSIVENTDFCRCWELFVAIHSMEGVFNCHG